MPLIDWDGFDKYGTVTAELLNGEWAQVTNATLVNTPTPRTGDVCCRLGNTTTFLRKVLPATLTQGGVGFGVYFEGLPSANGRAGVEFRNASNVANMSVTVESTGAIAAYRGPGGTGTLLGTSAPLAIVANAWQHIEISTVISDTVGRVDVRVGGPGGSTVLSLSNIDTANTLLPEFSQLSFGSAAAPGTFWDIDDVFFKDDLTMYGDAKVLRLMPNGDSGVQDWQTSTGTLRYACIDEVPPDSGDYIEAALPIAISNFNMEDLPAGVLNVLGLRVTGKMLKTDAGVASVKLGLVSAGVKAQGGNIPLSTLATFWHEIFLTDPASGAAWSPARVNAVLANIERSA